jgi:DNA repair exonuclease SbcCD ATPase subunit
MTLAEYMESSIFPNFDTKEACLDYVERNTWLNKEDAQKYVEDHFDNYKTQKEKDFFISAHQFADFMSNLPKPNGNMKDRIKNLSKKR